MYNKQLARSAYSYDWLLVDVKRLIDKGVLGLVGDDMCGTVCEIVEKPSPAGNQGALDLQRLNRG